jgi:hypothetical protein
VGNLGYKRKKRRAPRTVSELELAMLTAHLAHGSAHQLDDGTCLRCATLEQLSELLARCMLRAGHSPDMARRQHLADGQRVEIEIALHKKGVRRG